MGTRSLTHIYDAWFSEDEPRLLCTIYRQYDGYPDGHGAELSDFLLSKELVNGISGDPVVVFNGPGDLAAQLVAHLKIDGDTLAAGNIYIEEPGASDIGEEYVYTLTISQSGISIRAEGREGETLYDGPLDEFASGVTGAEA